jgi:hypothetical protein
MELRSYQSEAVDSTHIKLLEEKRDQIIRDLWCAFRDLSDVIEADDFTNEDLALWDLVTRHQAMQSRLR